MSTQQQRYKVIERIAAGGMAEVYRAESAGLEGFKKTVAIKRVLPHLAKKKEFIGMFLDEARLSAHLSHSNCVQVFDIGVGDNTYFIVMEYVDGADLKSVIETARANGHSIPPEVACFVCSKICEGLAYAHEAKDTRGKALNIVHRDMSPPNVLMTRYGEVKVVDFGLAKANSQLERSEPGIIKGKFSYLSPEAARGEGVDSRTDIYAVGIILWEMLAGRKLFQGETDLATVRMVQANEVTDIRTLNPAVPEGLRRVLARALTKDPKDRYPSAREMGKDLTTALFGMKKAVSAFDLASLVEDAMSDRAVEKKKTDKKNIIGSLIDDALLEFTSLQDDEADPSMPNATKERLGSAPLNLGAFENVQDWAHDLGLEKEVDARRTLPPDMYSAGNLAALEEDAPGVPLEPRLMSVPQARVPSLDGPATLDPDELEELAPEVASPQEAPASTGGMVAALVVLVAAAGAAGAYFGGLIP